MAAWTKIAPTVLIPTLLGKKQQISLLLSQVHTWCCCTTVNKAVIKTAANQTDSRQNWRVLKPDKTPIKTKTKKITKQHLWMRTAATVQVPMLPLAAVFLVMLTVSFHLSSEREEQRFMPAKPHAAIFLRGVSAGITGRAKVPSKGRWLLFCTAKGETWLV